MITADMFLPNIVERYPGARSPRPLWTKRLWWIAGASGNTGLVLIAAVANPVVFKLFELPGSRRQLLFNLATFNIPYRDVQLLGIAVVMILGVSLRLLPHAYGLREPSPGWRSFLF